MQVESLGPARPFDDGATQYASSTRRSIVVGARWSHCSYTATTALRLRALVHSRFRMTPSTDELHRDGRAQRPGTRSRPYPFNSSHHSIPSLNLQLFVPLQPHPVHLGTISQDARLPSSPFTMSYNMYRRETLRRLGIEQLPTILTRDEYDEPSYPFGGRLPVRTMPVRDVGSKLRRSY